MKEFKVYKVSERAQFQFMKICVSSWAKCKYNVASMDRKISRMANIGKVEEIGESKLVHYENLRLLVHNDTVINLNWDSAYKPHKVSEKYKIKYDKFVGGVEAEELSLPEQIKQIDIKIAKDEKYKERAEMKLNNLKAQKVALESIYAAENLQLLNA
ncbi:hypothetical protein ACI2JA_03460 [Alkalihalobacillus sp. NPDC078783]